MYHTPNLKDLNECIGHQIKRFKCMYRTLNLKYLNACTGP